MIQNLRPWLAMVPALVVFYLAGESFLEKYPRSQTGRVETKFQVSSQDSLLDFVMAANSRDSLVTASPATGAISNPFRPVHRRPTASEISASRTFSSVPPTRGFILKGTVGNEVATVTDAAGRRVIVKVGERLDSATVISIEANKVVLKDRAGKFELLLEQ